MRYINSVLFCLLSSRTSTSLFVEEGLPQKLSGPESQTHHDMWDRFILIYNAGKHTK